MTDVLINFKESEKSQGLNGPNVIYGHRVCYTVTGSLRTFQRNHEFVTSVIAHFDFEGKDLILVVPFTSIFIFFFCKALLVSGANILLSNYSFPV